VLLIENRALLDGYRSGQREALAAVFEHYAPHVARWISGGFDYLSGGQRVRFRGFSSPYDQHDLIGEIFRLAFEERARLGYSGVKPFEGYLFAIARNAVLKRIGAREPPSIGEEAIASVPAPDPSPEESAAREEERALVRRFLGELSEEERGFVDIRFQEQRSQNEVAEALGWSRKKVRIREEAIRQKLTRFLKRARGTSELVEALSDETR
jgi:RNA polymerase sigma factor (sigma-70 family)